MPCGASRARATQPGTSRTSSSRDPAPGNASTAGNPGLGAYHSISRGIFVRGPVDLLESLAHQTFPRADGLLFQVGLYATHELRDLQNLCHGQHPLLSGTCAGVRNCGLLLRIATPRFNPLHNELQRKLVCLVHGEQWR